MAEEARALLDAGETERSVARSYNVSRAASSRLGGAQVPVVSMSKKKFNRLDLRRGKSESGG